MSATAGSYSFVTMLTSDSYVFGVLALAASLRQSNSRYPLACMVTDNVSVEARARVKAATGSEPQMVRLLDSKDSINLELLGRPELGCTLTKVAVWSMTQFAKVVFLDADILVMQNIDELFEREELSACADAGWPDCFNSGLFVCHPSLTTYNRLLKYALTSGSFDGGDQGLLNAFFNDWSTGPSARRIPFVYNMTFGVGYSYLPALAYYKSDVRAVHFIGQRKPWTFPRASDGTIISGSLATTNPAMLEYIQKWWDMYDLSSTSSTSSQTCASAGTGALSPGQGGHPTGDSFSAASLQHSTMGNIFSLGPDACTGVDFGKYRVKWDEDVEQFFRNQRDRRPSSFVRVADEEDGTEAHLDHADDDDEYGQE